VKRVAVFGNAGGGKSTLSRRLAQITGLPLYVIDRMEYRAGGAAVPRDEYLSAHAQALAEEAWIIDGYGGVECAWERFERADTLVHVDLPLHTHFTWITKRLVESAWRPPVSWPESSPIISSTLSAYRVLWPCHTHLTPKYRALCAEARATKQVFHLRSVAEIEAFLANVNRQA